MPITLKNIAAIDVPTPATDKNTLFTDTDNLLYNKDDTGFVTQIGAGTVTSVSIAGNNGISISGSPVTTNGTITLGLGNITPGDITLSGDLTFTGTSKRITGDWTGGLSGGVFDRTYFQTSTVNGDTTLSLMPNGSNTLTAVTLENTSGSLTDSTFLSIFNHSTAYGIAGNIRGTGTYLPMHIDNGGVISAIIDISGNFNVQTNLTATGTVTGSNLSGTNTGDQTITLTGDVTGSGTGSFATTLSNTTVTPGSYTSADITIDAQGRITAASNGGGGVSEPLSQIVVGTGSGVTSSQYGLYDITTLGLSLNVDPFAFPANSAPIAISDPGNVYIYGASNDGSGASFISAGVYILAGLADNFNATAEGNEVIIRSGRNQNGITGASSGASEILLTSHFANVTSASASNILIQAGSTNDGSTPTGPENGGEVQIKCGDGRATAGTFILSAGNSIGLAGTSQTAGDFYISAGNVTGNAGSGDATGTAGSMYISAGRNLNGAGTHGSIVFSTKNTTRMTIDADGGISGQFIVSNSVPPTSVGSPGDVAGYVAYDSSFFYVCTGIYDGSTAIWVRATLSTF